MNKLQKLAVLAAPALAAPVAFAGDIADSINNNATVQGASADLTSVGTTVAGIIVVGVIFGALFKLFRKGG